MVLLELQVNEVNFVNLSYDSVESGLSVGI